MKRIIILQQSESNSWLEILEGVFDYSAVPFIVAMRPFGSLSCCRFLWKFQKLNSMCPKLRHFKCIRLQRVAHHNTKTLQEIPAKLQIAPPSWNRNSFFTTHPPKHPYIYMYIVYNLFTYVYYQTTQPSVKVTFSLNMVHWGDWSQPKTPESKAPQSQCLTSRW